MKSWTVPSENSTSLVFETIYTQDRSNKRTTHYLLNVSLIRWRKHAFERLGVFAVNILVANEVDDGAGLGCEDAFFGLEFDAGLNLVRLRAEGLWLDPDAALQIGGETEVQEVAHCWHGDIAAFYLYLCLFFSLAQVCEDVGWNQSARL